jgi:hypothetical protein
LTQNRTLLHLSLAAATILFACFVISGVASAQTSNSQQPPDFGDFNGTMASPPGNGNMPPSDFNGTLGFPNGSMGPGDGNFTRPDFSGAPDMNGANGQVAGSQTDYTLIIAVVAVVVVAVVSVVAVLLVRKKKTGKSPPPPSPTDAGSS